MIFVIFFLLILHFYFFLFFFFFNDTSTTEIYTLSLHDALPIRICRSRSRWYTSARIRLPPQSTTVAWKHRSALRSEEHTSELQSRPHLVCRLLLEKKKKKKKISNNKKKKKKK